MHYQLGCLKWVFCRGIFRYCTIKNNSFPCGLLLALLMLASNPAKAITANDDSRQIDLNTTRIINVLDNDQSPNIQSSTLRVCVAGQQENCPELSTDLIPPQKGSVSLASDGRSIIYTPNQGAIGADSFTYAVFAPDDQSAEQPSTATATVSITINLPSIKEGVSSNVGRLETIFNILCDPSTTDQIKNPELRETVIDRCTQYSNLSDADKLRALNTLTPEQVVAGYSATVTATKDQASNLASRLSEIRAGSKGISIAKFNYYQDERLLSGQWLQELAELVGGGASADTTNPYFARLGAFLNGSITRGDKDATSLERSFDLKANNITFGIDYRFNNDVTAGVGLGFTSNNVSFAGVDDMENKVTNLLSYGTWYKDNYYIDAVLGLAYGDITTQRAITIGNSTAIAKGETDSAQLFLNLTGNYDYVAGPWTLSPFAAFDLVDGVIESYGETGGQGFAAAFNDQKIESKIVTIGSRVQYAWNQPWGILIPHGRIEWKNELEKDRDLITGRFIVDPTNNQFSVEADTLDSSWLEMGVGLSATFQHGLSAFFDYNRLLGYNDLNLSTFSVGGRWEAGF